MTTDPSRMRQHVARQVTAGHASELLYGTVVTGSVLAVTSVHGGSDGPVLLTGVIVAVVYWLAHVYADAIGGRFADLDHSAGARLLDSLRTNTAVLLGALPPLGAFAAGRLGGLGVVAASWLALWFTVALLMSVGGFAGYRAGARGWRLIGEIAVAGVFGLMVIGLKFVLH